MSEEYEVGEIHQAGVFQVLKGLLAEFSAILGLVSENINRATYYHLQKLQCGDEDIHPTWNFDS